jgi:hypothetical protein
MAILRAIHQWRVPMIVADVNISPFGEEDLGDSRVAVLSGYRQC